MAPKDPESSARRLELFQALLQLEGEERAKELERLRGQDAALAAELEKLLEHEELAGEEGFLGRPATTTTGELPPGTWIGHFQVDRLIGYGGMGAVYLAHRHEPYQQAVAIKKMRRGLSERLVAQFHAERQILATLDHPGIVRLLDGGTDGDGSPYLAMEYVDGSRLDTYCQHQGLGRDDRVRMVLAVAEALASAHERGIVHRDLTPSNVMVGHDGRPRVMDFGLAKLVADAGKDHTRTDVLLGTPPYMAPERLTFGPGRNDPGVDVYALGVILFELVAGRRPFESDDPMEVSASATHEDAPPLRRVDPTIPRDLETITARALARDPRERFVDAGQVAEQLRHYLAGQPLTIRPPTAADRLGKWVGHHRRAIVAWGASFGVAMLVMIGLLVSWNRGLQRDRDALRETMRTMWTASTQLYEVQRPDDPHIWRFYEEIAQSFDGIRERGMIESDPSLDRQIAGMCWRLGAAHNEANDPTEALPLVDQSIALLRPLPARIVDPKWRLGTEFELFRGLSLRARVLDNLGRSDEALAQSDEALGIIRGLKGRFTDEPARLEAEARVLLNQLVIHEAHGRTDEVRALAREAHDLATRSVNLAGDEVDTVKLNTQRIVIGKLAQYASIPAEKERYYREALEVAEHQGRLPDGGSWSKTQSRLDALNVLGLFLVSEGRHAEARPFLGEALQLLDEQIAARPDDPIGRDQDRKIREALARCQAEIAATKGGASP